LPKNWITVAILATLALLGVLSIVAAYRATPNPSWVRAIIGGLIGFIIIDTVIIVVYALFLFTPYPYWILQFLHLIDR